MTKQGKVIVGSALGLLLALFLLYEFYWKEPSYKGKALSEWLAEADNASPGQRSEVIVAVQHIGSRALPYAFAMLHATNWPVQEQVTSFMNEYTIFKIKPAVPEDRLHRRALLALVALRNQEREIITSRLGQEVQRGLYAPEVSVALAFMGTNGLPLLLQALTNQFFDMRIHAANALCLPQRMLSDTNRGALWLDPFRLTQDELQNTAKAYSAAAVPSLLCSLEDPDPAVRHTAAFALDDMGQRPTNAVPIFITGLHAPDARDRRIAAHRLSRFGRAAVEAVPALTKLAEDPDPAVRSVAQRALKEIDPTALDKPINSQQ